MPRAAKHPCLHTGCGALVDCGTRYCPAHQQAADARQQEHARIYDEKRPEAKFYHGARWKRLRAWFLRRHPLCEMCVQAGHITPATVVDHIKEIADGGARYDPDNLQALCIACHNIKTADERAKRKK